MPRALLWAAKQGPEVPGRQYWGWFAEDPRAALCSSDCCFPSQTSFFLKPYCSQFALMYFKGVLQSLRKSRAWKLGMET